MGRSCSRRLQPSVRILGVLCLGAALVGALLGCGRGSFIGRQYDDFTAYYNTYHNAESAFEEGMESVTQSESSVDRAQYISIFPNPQTGSGGASFDKAIQKSADLLRNHSDSKWVDDALLLIGRARYYKQNYVGAAQKFREVIALEGEREGEARFRLARTLIAADRFSEASEALRVGLEQADYGTWTARMRLVQGELFVRQENWTEAEEALTQGLEGALPDQAGARASFLLGQVRETLTQLEGAQAAYERVLEFAPTYQLEFAARLGAIKMQGLNGEPGRALDRLASLERADNTNAMHGKIARVRARLLQEQGRFKQAKLVLTDALRGEDAPRGLVEGRIHYDLAALYRDTYEDFTKAAAHFDTAATALPSTAGNSDRDAQTDLLPGIPSDASGQAERFQGLADRSQAVARMDSLLRLGRMPPSEFRAVVERIRERRLEEQQRNARRERRQQFQGGARREAGPRPQQSAVQTRGSDAGFLFYRDPALVQQGRRQFQQRWGSRPLVDNWRRVNAIQSSGGASTAAEEGAGGRRAERGGASEAVVDLSVVPRDSASQADMEKKRIVAQYELANALFRAAGRPDSAETWFRRILKEDADHSVSRKALYGLAQTHRAQGDSAAAEDAYRQLLERYPDTPYATRAREQLGLESKASTTHLAASRADSAYAQAYETWQGGAPDAALGEFIAVAETYPETSTAPRALLAAGVVYHRSMGRDTSGRRDRFERFVDSLAQAEAPTGPGPPADTAEGSSRPVFAQDRPPTDTADGKSVPARAVDSTGRPRQIPQFQSSVQSPDTAATGAALNPAASDTSGGAEGQGPPRQMIDSTALAEQGRSSSTSDTTTTPSRAPPVDSASADSVSADSASADSLGRPDQAADSVRVGRTQPSKTDSARAESKRSKPESLRILLVHLAETYSGTPAAKRAQSLLGYLKKQQAAADSTSPDSSTSAALIETEASSDSAAGPSRADSLAGTGEARQEAVASPDSLARPRSRPPDTTRAPEDTLRRAPRPDSTASPGRDSTGSPSIPPSSPSDPTDGK
mgnify:CR=1 FL=1